MPYVRLRPGGIAKELLQHHEQIRVATKYPRIAKDYFYNQKASDC